MHSCVAARSALILSLVLFSGCGGGDTSPTFVDNLVPVTGSVTVDGEKLAGVDVTLSPSEGESGQIALGKTDADGNFTLYTPPGGPNVRLEYFPGVVPGAYKVTFSRFVLPDGTPWDSRNSTEGPMNVGATETMPPQLTNPHTTPHTVVIVASGDNAADFQIVTKR